MEIKPKNTIQDVQEPTVAPVQEQAPASVELEEKAEVKLEEKPVYQDSMSNAFISDTLDDLEKMLDEEEAIAEAAPTPVEASEVVKPADDIASLLSNIKVDLNNIEISNGGMIDIQRTENLFNAKPTKHVVCCQSAYTAQISALKSREITNLTESDSDYYTYRKKITQIAHSHIESTSIGKINYPTFSKITSFYDFETILYGIYCQTFPENNNYRVKCPAQDCGKVVTAMTHNNQLVETRGKENVFERVNEVIASVKNEKDCLEKSTVHKLKRVILDETKIIADICIPTIHDYIEGILNRVTPQMAEDYSVSLGLSLFISKLFIPDLAKLKETGKLTYFEIDDKIKIIKYIGDVLSYYDSLQLSDEINDFTERYRVTYSLKNVTCPHCGHVIEEIPLDMEELLFRAVRQGRVKPSNENNEQNM